MVRKEGGGVREAASPAVSRRREKAPRFGQQARCAPHLARACGRARAIRRANRAGAKRGRAGAGAGAHYARIRVPPHGPAGGGADGTEWNETGERNDMQEADGHGFRRAGACPLSSPRTTRQRRSGGSDACSVSCPLVSVMAERLPFVMPGLVPRLSGSDVGRGRPGVLGTRGISDPTPVRPPYRHGRTCSGHPLPPPRWPQRRCPEQVHWCPV